MEINKVSFITFVCKLFHRSYYHIFPTLSIEALSILN